MGGRQVEFAAAEVWLPLSSFTPGLVLLVQGFQSSLGFLRRGWEECPDSDLPVPCYRAEGKDLCLAWLRAPCPGPMGAGGVSCWFSVTRYNR